MGKRKRKPHLGDRGETIVYALAGESDRGCALVAAEFLSDALKHYLRVKFTKEGAPKSLQNRLLEGLLGPLDSLAMRTNICRAIGLIGPKTFKAINDIREIRNRCAHQTSFSLQDVDIQQYIGALASYLSDMKSEPGEPNLRRMWKSVGEDFAAISAERATLLNAAFTVHDWVWSRGFYLSQGTDYVTV